MLGTRPTGHPRDAARLDRVRRIFTSPLVAPGLLAAAMAVTLTDARGLVGVLVLLATFAVASRWGRRAGMGVAGGAGAVALVMAPSWKDVSTLGLVLTATAVPLWVALAWVAGVTADERRRMTRETEALLEQLQHRSLHDPLTGLANRKLLLDRLERALQRVERHRTQVAVLFVDVDGFKPINDELGHVAGDGILVEIARRLSAELRASDTAARFGGDEFVVVCEDLHDDAEAFAVAQRMCTALRRPLPVSGGHSAVTASIGITLASSAAQDPRELLAHADQAMYRAKRTGGDRCAVFRMQMPTAHLAPRTGSGAILRPPAPRDGTSERERPVR